MVRFWNSCCDHICRIIAIKYLFFDGVTCDNLFMSNSTVLMNLGCTHAAITS